MVLLLNIQSVNVNGWMYIEALYTIELLLLLILLFNMRILANKSINIFLNIFYSVTLVSNKKFH